MSSLKFCHINVRSLVNGFDKFKEKVNNKFDIISISESWLTANIHNEDIKINGYKIFRADRKGRGGGVAIYIKNCIRAKTLVNDSNNGSEQLWLTFTFNKITYAFGTLYRPPSYLPDTFISELDETLSNIFPKFQNVIITGDFNIDFLNQQASHFQRLINLIDTYEMKQVVQQPTRIGPTSIKILDLIICSKDMKTRNCGVFDCSSFSDHWLVTCEIGLERKKIVPFFIERRDFRNFDEKLFYNDLKNSNFQPLYQYNSVEDKLRVLNNIVLENFDKYAPMKKMRISKPEAPWLTQNLRFMMSLRDKAAAKYKKTQLTSHYHYYKDLRNLVNRTVNLEKKAYLEFRIKRSNKKTMWQDLQCTGVYQKKGRELIPEHLGDVNKINNYFVTTTNAVCTLDDTLLNFYQSTVKENTSLFEFTYTNEEDIFKQLLSIKSNSMGVDNINVKMLLYCCPFLLRHIKYLFNYCIDSGKIPSLWKIAQILPLPKKTSPEDLSDLRPISILCVLSKLFEKILSMQMRLHISHNQILPSCQSGFRPHHSCISALAKVTDDILNAIDNSKLCALVLLDYSKAFDKINHKMLLSILHYSGFSGNSLRILSNYLENRKQCVIINQSRSDCLQLLNGVPQGSILGPLLFILYTSLFPKCLKHASAHLYADDSQIYLPFHESQLDNSIKLLNDDINRLSQLSNKYGITINPKKTVAMLFGPKAARMRCRNKIKISINGETIPVKDSARNLGVIYDSSLKFTEHVTHILRKSYANLKIIYSNKAILTKQTKTLLCDALVLSHANYADVIYGPALRLIDQNRLQKLQNSCVRFITCAKRRDHVTEYCRQIGWLKMKERRILHSCCFIRKILDNKTPSYLYEKISFRTDVHNLNLRHRGLMNIPKHRTGQYKSSFTYFMSRLFNRISDKYMNLSFNLYKKHIKKDLFKGQLEL